MKHQALNSEGRSASGSNSNRNLLLIQTWEKPTLETYMDMEDS